MRSIQPTGALAVRVAQRALAEWGEPVVQQAAWVAQQERPVPHRGAREVL